MTTIVRHGLFNDTLDDIFRGFLVHPLATYETPVVPQFRMDVAETDNAYRVTAELPGVKKEDIGVTVEGDTVTVTVEVRAEKEARDGERVLLTERYRGKLARSFSLGQEVDEAGAEARYTDGVLELVLPKKAAAARKRLAIN